MSHTVGLDFGTHQTKVCVEDASNPAQKVYEFLEFEIGGDTTVLFPSIVQINQDDTVSYGFVDDMHCKTISDIQTLKPQLEIPLKPQLVLPPKPTLLPYPPKPKKQDIRGRSIKEQLIYQEQFKKDLQNWKDQRLQIDKENKNKLEEWKLDYIAVKNDYDYDIEQYLFELAQMKKDYEIALTKWEKDNSPQKQQFRYFKLETFYPQSNWEYVSNRKYYLD